MNQLARIVEESGLEESKAQIILEQFKDYFEVAAEWEKKAKSLVVTNESQEAEMKMARTGRLEMRDRINAVEVTRKKLKEQSLREGQTIDGLAKTLKGLMIPIRDHLLKQEKFVVLKKEAEAETRRIEADRLLAEKEAAEEKALQKKIEDERLENIRLKEEAEEKARLAQIETDKAVAKQKKIDEAAKAEREKHQFEIEEKQRIAFEREEKLREENERKLATERERQDVEKRELEKKRIVGQNRQDLLFIIDARIDFNTCANMTDEAFDKFYEEKKEEYRVEQARIYNEKQRVEREQKEREKKEKEKSSRLVKCPQCGSMFIPELKLL